MWPARLAVSAVAIAILLPTLASTASAFHPLGVTDATGSSLTIAWHPVNTSPHASGGSAFLTSHYNIFYSTNPDVRNEAGIPYVTTAAIWFLDDRRIPCLYQLDPYSTTITGLQPSTTYYFSIKAIADHSTVTGCKLPQFCQCRLNHFYTYDTISGTTTDGGGPPGGGSPFIAPWNGTAYAVDNNILPKSEAASRTLLDVDDYYRLHEPLFPKDGRYSLRIVEFEDEHTRLDHVRLLAVDHDRDFRIAVGPSGGMYPFETPEPPATAVDNYGRDVRPLVSVEDGAFYEGWRGDFVDIAFGKVPKTSARLMLKADICSPCKISVDVYVLSNGLWAYVDTVHPRIRFAWEVVDMSAYLPSDDLVLRLHTTRFHKLDFVGLDTSPQHPVRVQEARMMSAVHSGAGDALSLLTGRDGRYADIKPGQYVTVEFDVPAPLGDRRSFVFVSHGYYTHRYQPYGGEDVTITGLNLQARAFLPQGTSVFTWEVNLTGLTWDFGDGAYATGLSVSRMYAQPGEYVLTVQLAYADGTIRLYERRILVVG